MVIADVSGKGIPAALFMMMVTTQMQNCARQGLSPSEVLRAVNEQLCATNREKMFVTAWLGILDLKTGHLRAANAGHEYPVLRMSGGSFEVLKDRHSFVLGGMSGVQYKEYELELKPGSSLFLYTDGVPEATRADNEMFGMQRTLDALNSVSDDSPRVLLEGVEAAVRLFVQDEPQFDDLTMMCVRYMGKE
jgi:sigma-B regulation protein RsbU (phosphoserine phosphatase)